MGEAIGGIAGSLVSGYFGQKGAEKSSDAMLEAAMIAAEQFKPYNVNTALGSLNVDGQNITTKLGGQAQGLLDLYAGEAGQGLGEATQERLGIMDQLAARGEEEARRYTREGLFAAGNLGTHYGTRQIGEVEQAIANAQLQRQLSARDMAFQERQGAFGNALSMYQVGPAMLGGLSLNRTPGIVGQGIMQSAGPSAAFNQQAYSQFGSTLGSAVSNAPWGDIWDSVSGAFSGGGSSGSMSAPYGQLFGPF